MLHNSIQAWQEANIDYVNYDSKSIYLLFIAYNTVWNSSDNHANRYRFHRGE